MVKTVASELDAGAATEATKARSGTVSRRGRALRATIYRPDSIRRVAIGLGFGLRLTVDPKAPLHKYVGTAEIELSKYIWKFARPRHICFDVGGYDAHLAMTLARRTQARVWSFEFKDECVARMRQNLALNPRYASRVQVVQTFVAHESVVGPSPTDTLDDLIASGQIDTPDFVKIDVEGAELTVLSGATKLLRDRKPHLLIETHSEPLTAKCLTQLAIAGYEPLPTVQPRKWLPENRGDGRNEWIVAPGRESRKAEYH